MHAYTPANNIFDGPLANLFSVLCVLVDILSSALAKRGKSLNGFKFGTPVGRFSSDGAASRAVNGLNTHLSTPHPTPTPLHSGLISSLPVCAETLATAACLTRDASAVSLI